MYNEAKLRLWGEEIEVWKVVYSQQCYKKE
jgi:hypothetical protein